MTKPEQKFKAGAISATLWKNQSQKNGQTIEYHTVSLERNYKDQSGQWKSTSSMRQTDLPKAVLVLSKAFEHLSMAEEA